ncbi:hypothetical protein BJF83_05400 [Nocardiopsis sp. CNR-923]|uniref:hypothetical protein n=1 Tax=Nocardiopsis sp. CNR-923 TaxID=1904965 RepID=UPI0009683C61|nr:hypothetical protein [Nocardiopsis sp. CNR-923]OLT25592.1 hypothetical protein BJF83_05400 [Nocardiopsis sp. CNR-923]
MANVTARPSLLPMTGALVAAAVAALLGLAAAGVVVPVSLVGWPHEERRVPVAELLFVCAASAGAWSNRPRLWIWERLGGVRTRLRAAAVAALGVSLPVLAVLAVLPAVDHAQDRWLMVTNVLLSASGVYLLAPVLGPVVSGTTVLGGVFAGAVACNAVPGLHRAIPYAYAGGHGWAVPDLLPPGAVPALAVASALAAVGVHAATRGATTRVHLRTEAEG